MNTVTVFRTPPFVTSFYRWLVTILGLCVAGIGIFEQAQRGFDSGLYFLIALTALIASQVRFKMSSSEETISVTDAFVFLALLQWGIPAAILVAAAAELPVFRWNAIRRFQSYLFNISAAVTAAWLAGITLQITFRAAPEHFVSVLSDSGFIMSVGLMGLLYYCAQMSLTAFLQTMQMTARQWRVWMRQFYTWRCLILFIASAAAGATIKFAGNLYFFSILIIALIILLVYFTYQAYIKSLDALQESEERFRSSFDYATVGMALVSPRGEWLRVNQSMSELLARHEKDLLKTPLKAVLFGDDAALIETEIADLLKGYAPTFQHEIRFVRSDGAVVWAILSASVTYNAGNTVRHIILQTQDVTLRKKAEEKLLYDASHDALTGLHNRASFVAHLAAALRRTNRNKESKLAVLFLDLDGFKLINDSLGHAVGDEMLKIIGQRIIECLRTRDVVARLGGDEFTILLEDLEDINRAIEITNRIQQKLAEPFQLAGQEVFISTSIGIATSEINYQDSGDLLRDSDAAMYQAKARGKNCHVVFDHEMHWNAARSLRLANDLRRAAERNEFVLHYQSIQSLETDVICGFEALVRWQHPHYGLLMPSEFITLAEENGLSGEIDRWAMLTACRQLREWQLLNPDYNNLTISVNVSTKQFAQDNLYAFVKKVLAETDLSPLSLQLEVTESAMVQNLRNTARVLTALHDLGVSIALDDFGTGYSSLSYLHELPISTLKIDRSFINRLHDETDGAAIVRAIIVLARNLQIKVVAEGVETLDQFKHLRGMNCEYGQGFLFSRPISAADALKLLNLSAQNASQIANHNRNQLRLVSNN